MRNENSRTYLVFLILCILGALAATTNCENHIKDGTPNLYKVSTVKKGDHDFDKGDLRITTKRGIRVHFYIPKESRYQIPTADSLDLNKGPGLMTAAATNHKNSCMLGWRLADKVYASPYQHKANGDKWQLWEHEQPALAYDTWHFYQIEDQGSYWLFILSNGYRLELPKKNTTPPYRISGWWFGGQQPAPKDLTVYWYMERLDT